MKKIRCLVFDVDGTLTDGKIHISSDGELYKSFDVKDGYGIKCLLPCRGIQAAIITGRKSQIVELRARELGIKYVYQNIKDKAAALQDLRLKLGISLEEIAFMGDDVNDLPAMKIAGIAACPKDAVEEVKQVCAYVCKKKGGGGAAREWIEHLIEQGLG